VVVALSVARVFRALDRGRIISFMFLLSQAPCKAGMITGQAPSKREGPAHQPRASPTRPPSLCFSLFIQHQPDLLGQ